MSAPETREYRVHGYVPVELVVRASSPNLAAAEWMDKAGPHLPAYVETYPLDNDGQEWEVCARCEGCGRVLLDSDDYVSGEDADLCRTCAPADWTEAA